LAIHDKDYDHAKDFDYQIIVTDWCGDRQAIALDMAIKALKDIVPTKEREERE
jgi:hypothetical protein